MKDLVEVRIYISSRDTKDNVFLTSFYPVTPSSRISKVKWLLCNRLEIPVDLQILISFKSVIPDEDHVCQYAVIQDVWRPPAYTADIFLFVTDSARIISTLCNKFKIPTLVEPFDLSSWNLQVPIKLHPMIAEDIKNNNYKEPLIFDRLVDNSMFYNKLNMSEQKTFDSDNDDNDLLPVRFSSSYVLPFMFPEGGQFPDGSTAYDVMKYIMQCSRFDARFIDLCRKGENVSLEDGEELCENEVSSGIDLEVMRKFNVRLHNKVDNTRQVLQYTVRDGNTTIGILRRDKNLLYRFRARDMRAFVDTW